MITFSFKKKKSYDILNWLTSMMTYSYYLREKNGKFSCIWMRGEGTACITDALECLNKSNWKKVGCNSLSLCLSKLKIESYL